MTAVLTGDVPHAHLVHIHIRFLQHEELDEELASVNIHPPGDPFIALNIHVGLNWNHSQHFLLYINTPTHPTALALKARYQSSAVGDQKILSIRQFAKRSRIYFSFQCASIKDALI